MFSIRGRFEGAYHASLVVQSGARVYAAFVESADLKGHGTFGIPSVLFDAVGSMPPGGPETWAKRMGQAVQTVLEGRAEQRRQPCAVFFAAVMLKPSRVSVCWSGDIRIHLISTSEVPLRFTRGHVLSNEPSVNMRPEKWAKMRRSHPNVPTRMLGWERLGREPECLEWETPDPYTVVVCSSEFHRNQPSGEYLRYLFDDAKWKAKESSDDGLLLRIDSSTASS